MENDYSTPGQAASYLPFVKSNAKATAMMKMTRASPAAGLSFAAIRASDC